MGIYIISDTHFGDANIIEAFDRPFESTESMNKSMVDNWNSTVSEDDSIIIVGDFARVEKKNEIWLWLSKLNGEKMIVYGDHCPVARSSFEESELPLRAECRFEKAGYEFYCAHKPGWLPEDENIWKIHGHVHDRYPEEFPFIDPKNKTINVSAELLGYSPITIDSVVELLETGQRYVRCPEERSHN